MPNTDELNPLSGLPLTKLKPKLTSEADDILELPEVPGENYYTEESEQPEESDASVFESDEFVLPPLEEISAASISIDTIDTVDYIRNDKQEAEKAIASQMMHDDLSLDLSEKPKLDDLSSEYKPSYDRTKSLIERPTLERNEKDLLKERMQRELSSKPEQFDQKKSLMLYNKLMDEQKVRYAKKGFVLILLMVLLGLGSAAITYFFLDWKSQPYFKYLALSATFFSFVLAIKVKPAKVLSTLFFAAFTIILIGPGLVKFAIDAELNSSSYVTIIAFVGAILMSGFICFQLSTSEAIEAYYTTNLLTEKKSVVDESRSKYRQ